MAILLGENGQVELRRTSAYDPQAESPQAVVIEGTVNASDVNATKDRFSFDFDHGALINGDRIEIQTTTAGELLEFIAPTGWPDNKRYNSGIFFIHIDDAGGIRLYNDFSDAIAGEQKGIVDLVTPSKSIAIKITLRQINYRVLGQVKQYELNTERELIDISSLSKDFKQNYSGLISGNGTIQCFFDYEVKDCDGNYRCFSNDLTEIPLYFHQLLLRTTVGSEFLAKLTVVRRGGGSTTDGSDDSIWYEFLARATKVAIEFIPDQPIVSTIEFVATGPLRLKVKNDSDYITQEDLGLIAMEANQARGYLETESAD